MIRRDQEIYDNNAPITGVIIWVCQMAQAVDYIPGAGCSKAV